MPNSWLLKTEPSTYSFARLAQDRRAVWDGVRNNLALSHLRGMKECDRVLIYHTGNEKQVGGTARVVRAAYPDPSQQDPKLVVVDLEAEGPLAAPVTLSAIKADPVFKEFPLVRMGRLSVMPVPVDLWKRLLSMGAGK